jgi:hypothetical protein
MKKILTVLGGIFAILLVLFGVVAIQATLLDRESSIYADDSIRAIATTWNEEALQQRASPELLSSASGNELDRVFIQLRPLGRMMHYDGSKCSSNLFYGTGGKRTTAACNGRAEFEHGQAEMNLLLIKHNVWQVGGFHVMPHVLAAGTTSS